MLLKPDAKTVFSCFCLCARCDFDLDLGTVADRQRQRSTVARNAYASAITPGDGFTCALRVADGGVVCWGRNRDGELGDGTFEQRNAPVVVNQLPPVGKPTFAPPTTTIDATLPSVGSNTQRVAMIAVVLLVGGVSAMLATRRRTSLR